MDSYRIVDLYGFSMYFSYENKKIKIKTNAIRSFFIFSLKGKMILRESVFYIETRSQHRAVSLIYWTEMQICFVIYHKKW